MTTHKPLALFAVAALMLTLWGCAATTPDVSEKTRARIELANSHLQNNQPRRSLQELLPIRDNADDIPEYHLTLGMTYLQLDGKIGRAIEELEQTTELAPELGMAWNNLGRAYIAANRLDKAEEALKRALSIETYLTPEYAAYNLSRIYREQKRLQEAIEYADRALRENWRYLPAYFLLAELHTQQGTPEKAEKTLEQGVEAFPDNAQLWLQFGKIQLRLGKQDQAAQSFQRVLDIAPDSEPAQVARDYLDLRNS